LKALRTSWTFFIYSNLFIAVCAVLLTHQLYRLVLNSPVNPQYAGFVFFSTLCSYSFHWYFSSTSVLPSARINWLNRFRNVHAIFFFLGLAGVLFFISYFLEFWPWLLAAAAATFLYSAPKIPNKYLRLLRKVALGKTIFLAAVWTYVTTVLPIIISGQDWTPAFSLFVISRYFFIYAICILFDLRDREDDKAAGIRSLITYLGTGSIKILFTISLLIFAIATLLLYNYHFSSVQIMLLSAPGIILALLYNRASRDFSDMLYYFVLDGLLAFSALLTLIAGI